MIFFSIKNAIQLIGVSTKRQNIPNRIKSFCKNSSADMTQIQNKTINDRRLLKKILSIILMSALSN